MVNKDEPKRWKHLKELIAFEKGDPTKEILAKAKSITIEIENDIDLLEKDIKNKERLEDEIRGAARRHGAPYLQFFGELDKERALTAKEHKLLIFYRAMFNWYRDYNKGIPELLAKHNNEVFEYLGYREVDEEVPKKEVVTKVEKAKEGTLVPNDEQIDMINGLEAEGLAPQEAMKRFCEEYSGVGSGLFYKWRNNILNEPEEVNTDVGT